MKSGLEKRLKALETVAVTRIETLADYVLWNAKGRRGKVEFSPEILKFIEEMHARAKEKDGLSTS